MGAGTKAIADRQTEDDENSGVRRQGVEGTESEGARNEWV